MTQDTQLPYTPQAIADGSTTWKRMYAMRRVAITSAILGVLALLASFLFALLGLISGVSFSDATTVNAITWGELLSSTLFWGPVLGALLPLAGSLYCLAYTNEHEGVDGIRGRAATAFITSSLAAVLVLFTFNQMLN